MHRLLHILALLCIVLAIGCATSATDTSTVYDVPGTDSHASKAPDSAGAFESPVMFVSEGDSIHGSIAVAKGAGPHPTVLFLSGFPGWPEAPPELLDPIRAAGYNVLFFPYRGTWASGGRFSAENALADAGAAMAFLRSPEAVSTYRVDGDAIALYGTSFGGWTALSLAAEDPHLNCVGTTVPLNLGAMARQWSTEEDYRQGWYQTFEQMTAELPIRLESGPSQFMATIMDRADQFDLMAEVPALQDETIILFGAEQDEIAPLKVHYQPLADALSSSGMERLTLMTSPGGHQDLQPSWDAALIEWLRDDCFAGR